ncbi:hypothetical protein V9T40_012927 [Parthenolecanium corni]|uniref:Matrix metalloproteinase n=1 Tax=Parthenolecanium corni TaxID=536013 RepID=A0AAN9T9T9_9HEMI
MGVTEARFSDTQAGIPLRPIDYSEELSLCDDSDVDDVIIVNATYYVFKRQKVWFQIKRYGERVYRTNVTIKDVFPNLDDDIDAAYSEESNDVYFFKGPMCWKYKLINITSFSLYSGYPRTIDNDFPGIPSGIQAVTKVSAYRNGFIYFFKDNLFYRFEPKRVPHIRSTYPRLISDVWNGIPDNLNGCVYDPRKKWLFFFKGLNYLRFDMVMHRMSYNGTEQKTTAEDFFDCVPRP